MRALGRGLAVLALSLAVVAAAGVLVAGPGYRFGGWGLGGAFVLLRWGAMLGLAAVLFGWALIAERVPEGSTTT